MRLATLEDAEDILEIYGPFVEDTWTSFEEEVPTLDDMEERIEIYMADFPWLVAESKDELTGYAYANPYRHRPAYRWTAEVSVYVAPHWHGRNVASGLYEKLFEILSAQNIRIALAGVTLPNPKSQRFHEKMGFEQIGIYREVGYKFGHWHDVMWMQKLLNPNDPPEEFVPFLELDWDF